MSHGMFRGGKRLLVQTLPKHLQFFQFRKFVAKLSLSIFPVYIVYKKKFLSLSSKWVLGLTLGRTPPNVFLEFFQDQLQWNLDLSKCQGTGEIDSLYRASSPYITLLLGWKISFVIPRTSLYNGSSNRGSTVLPRSAVFSCCAHIPTTHFDISFVRISCYGYEIWRHK